MVRLILDWKFVNAEDFQTSIEFDNDYNRR